MSIYQSSDIGFCHYAGHTGSVTLTWDNDTVVSIECSFGNHNSCPFVNTCELYQRHPIGFVQIYPSKPGVT